MGTDESPTGDPDETRQATATEIADPVVIASGKRLDGRYRLERPLGRGGMAAVWLATDERLGRPVAVKVLSDTLVTDEQYLTRFRREARTAASLQHPNLVTVYDYGAGERPYLVMEYIEGGDLAERLERGERPDPHRLAEELLSALRYIHAAGVLHRDIKPQNVLIDTDGRARLTDFGIAQPAGATALTRTGHLIGTESYIAPELKRGEPHTERADLYALGVVLADVAREGAGASLWELVDRLRDSDPERRPRSATAALAQLERGSRTPLPGTRTKTYEITEDTPAAPPPAAPRTFEPSVPAPRRRGSLPGWLALGAIAVALVAGLLLLGGGDEGGDGSGALSANRAGEQAKPGGGGAAEDPAGAEPAADESADEAAALADPKLSDDGYALNDQGYQLLVNGQAEEAIPYLERAVKLLRGSDDATYYYALFNLGSALVAVGRPDEAIPYLQERMEFDDGQLAKVEDKLNEAYAAAGIEPESGETDGGPKKNGKLPPGQEKKLEEADED